MSVSRWREGGLANGSITIARNSHDEIQIEVRDETSHISFLHVTMTPEQLGMAITGRVEVPVTFDLSGVEWVGKRKVRERRQAKYPGQCYDRDKLAAWLESEHAEPGWTIDLYLGSQGSLAHLDGETTVNYWVYRWEDAA